MPRYRCLLLSLLLMLPCAPVDAEVMVLLQGYLGDDDPWRRSGVTTVLATAGWRDAGHLYHTPRGVMRTLKKPGAPRQFYTVALPSQSPLLQQLRALVPLLQHVQQQHPGESLYLVGHSAGGVLARLYMVQYPANRISALITIASPHLGTASAEAGLMAGDSPLGWMAPLLGDLTLYHSRGLYHDLVREQSGNLLYWLNRQPHPHSRYVSVVRRGGGLLGLGDWVVPDWSQDMNNVRMLRGRALTLHVGGDHYLSIEDGRLLLRILQRLQRL
jgi:pimeloyl-ACP methyl ester carboxylesterase